MRYSKAAKAKVSHFNMGPIVPVTPRGLLLREIVEAIVELAGPEFDFIELSLKSVIEMGLTRDLKGVSDAQVRVITDARDERGVYVMETTVLKNGGCISFKGQGESDAELLLTLKEMRRGKQWGSTLDDLKDGFTNSEMLKRHGLTPDLN